AERPGLHPRLHFDRRIAAAIEDFAGDDVDDLQHLPPSMREPVPGDRLVKGGQDTDRSRLRQAGRRPTYPSSEKREARRPHGCGWGAQAAQRSMTITPRGGVSSSRSSRGCCQGASVTGMGISSTGRSRSTLLSASSCFCRFIRSMMKASSMATSSYRLSEPVASTSPLPGTCILDAKEPKASRW